MGQNASTTEQRAVHRLLREWPTQNDDDAELARGIAVLQPLLLSCDLCNESFNTVEPMLSELVQKATFFHLLRYCHQQLDLASSNAHLLYAASLMALSATLRLTQFVVVALLRCANGVDTVLFEWLRTEDEDKVLLKLVTALVNYTIRIPCSATTARSHCEALQLLLVVTSNGAFRTEKRHEPVTTAEHLFALGFNDALCFTLLDRVARWGVSGNRVSSFHASFADGTLFQSQAPPFPPQDGARPPLSSLPRQPYRVTAIADRPQLYNLYHWFGMSAPMPYAASTEDGIGVRSLQLLLHLCWYEARHPRRQKRAVETAAAPNWNVDQMALHATSSPTLSRTSRRASESARVPMYWNPMVDALSLIQDSESANSPRADSEKGVRRAVYAVSFGALCRTAAAQMSRYGEAALLLYLLLVHHPFFLHVVLSNHSAVFGSVVAELGLLLLQLWRASVPASHAATSASVRMHAWERWRPFEMSRTEQLHGVGAAQMHHLVASLLLCLSQDVSVNSSAFSRWKAPLDGGVSGTPLSVGCETLYACARVMPAAMAKSDISLATICAGVIGNMAPFAHGVDPHAAQRMLRTIVWALRQVDQRVERSKNSARRANDDDGEAASKTTLNAAVDLAYDFDAKTNALGSVASVLLHAVRVMVDGPDRHNDAVIYELLYHFPQVAALATIREPTVAVAIDLSEAWRPLQAVRAYYDSALARGVTSAQPRPRNDGAISVAEGELQWGTQDVSEILSRIRQVASGTGVIRVISEAASEAATTATGPSYDDCLELMFCYEEHEDARWGFFQPLLWQCILGLQLPLGIGWGIPPKHVRNDRGSLPAEAQSDL